MFRLVIRAVVIGAVLSAMLIGCQEQTATDAPTPAISDTTPPTSEDLGEAIAALERGDYTAALRVVRPLAQQGYASAQFILGQLYRTGQGVVQDDRVAAEWYKDAAEQGNVAAQNNLALMFYNGMGVPKDHAEAVKWFAMAADQGFASAQYYLADMYGIGYGIGDGVAVDHIISMKWRILAAKHGDRRAIQFREFIARAMKPSELSEAQRLADEWLEQHQGKKE